MNSSKNRLGRGRSSKNNGYWTKNRTLYIRIYTRNQHYMHYIHDTRLLSIYTRMHLKANLLYIETHNDLKIGLKIEPLLLKIEPGISSKNRRYWTKNRLVPYPRLPVRLRTLRHV